jgi:hypothetical protein
MGHQQAGDRAKERGLARAVGPEQRDDRAGRHGHEPAQDQRHIVVDDLQSRSALSRRRRPQDVLTQGRPVLDRTEQIGLVAGADRFLVIVEPKFDLRRWQDGRRGAENRT